MWLGEDRRGQGQPIGNIRYFLLRLQILHCIASMLKLPSITLRRQPSLVARVPRQRATLRTEGYTGLHGLACQLAVPSQKTAEEGQHHQLPARRSLLQ